MFGSVPYNGGFRDRLHQSKKMSARRKIMLASTAQIWENNILIATSAIFAGSPHLQNQKLHRGEPMAFRALSAVRVSALRCAAVSGVLFFCFQSPAAKAQPAAMPAPGTLGAELVNDVQPIMKGPCAAWPLKGVKDIKHQIDQKNAEDISAPFILALAGKLGVDPNKKAEMFASSPTRLFDTPVTDLGKLTLVGDVYELGLRPVAAPTNMYDTDFTTIKYDCLTLTQLAANANPTYSLPFATINGAFSAALSSTSQQTVTFVTGSFESPFELITRGTSPRASNDKIMYAAMRAIAWKLANPTQNTYLASAKLLSVTSSSTEASATSLLGDMKAGINLSLVNSSNEIKGQITNSMERDSHSFRTFYWDSAPGTFPELSVLSGYIAHSMDPLVTQVVVLKPGEQSYATATYIGWPPEMCNSGLWTASASNDRYTADSVTMTAVPAASNTTLPQCAVRVDFTFVALHAGEQASQNLIAYPGLALTYNGQNAVTIAVQTSPAIQILGQPTTIVSADNVVWQTSGGGSPPAAVKWSTHVSIRYPLSPVITQSALDINPADFKCVNGATTYRFDTVKLENAADANGWHLSTSSPDFVIDYTLNTGGGSFNTDVGQPAKLQCEIIGQVSITATDSTHHAIAPTAPISMASPISYPNVAVVTPPPVPAPVSPPPD